MKKLILVIIPLALAACAGGMDSKFAADPAHYGLYVASVDVQMDTAILVKNAQSGEEIPLKVTHTLHGGDTGYVDQALPAGRYLLEKYTPDGQSMVSLETPDGYFDVDSGCFNYGGHYTFGTGADGKPTYQDSTTLKDIESLPGDIRHQAKDHDVCSAAMGEGNQRLAAADAAQQLDL